MALAVSNLCAWAPGITSKEEWKTWANGEAQIALTKDAPKLEYTDMLFRRRLSQISKMTVQVVHDVLERTPEAKLLKQVFVSFRGELAREFQVSKTLVEEHAISPANFSLSVFNTPIALATIALDLHAGYTVIYPSKENFLHAFQGAVSPILSGHDEKIILVYADELVPIEYSDVESTVHAPFAFATIISKSEHNLKSGSADSEVKTVVIESISEIPENATGFLKFLINRGAV